MIATAQDPSLLVLTNVVLGIVCALFWLWVLAVTSCEIFRRWRARASLPRGWPPHEQPVIPDLWPPVEEESLTGPGTGAGTGAR